VGQLSFQATLALAVTASLAAEVVEPGRASPVAGHRRGRQRELSVILVADSAAAGVCNSGLAPLERLMR
jgi:hypothetical protein